MSETSLDDNYDLFVIGAGSGGVRAARIAASYGAKVAIAEDYRVGGTCVIRGCVPKKLYVLASRFHDEFEDARGFGWRVTEPSFDWPTLVAAKEKEITRLSGLYQQTLANAGVTTFHARATLAGPNEVLLSTGKKIRAKYILIATGGGPVAAPAIVGIEHGLSSNEIFDLPQLPKRLLIIGSGYIAVEFASVFARFGIETHLSYRANLPLRGFDEALRSSVAQGLEDAGVILHASQPPKRIEKKEHDYLVELDGNKKLEVDCILIATGRKPATQALGLERAGVKTRDSGAIIVDAQAQTSVASIYAVGDVTDRLNLTPVAIREGHAFADRIFGHKLTNVNYDLVASAVFTTPEIGAIGLTELEAQEKFPKLDIYETQFRPMRATLSGRSEKVYMKLIVEAESQRIIGAHICGPDAGEMIQLLAIPLQMGARKEDFDATMAVHPTLAEELVTMRQPARRHQKI
ncbi:MAG: glutathione-disulfide reductase [Methylocystis sp.]